MTECLPFLMMYATGFILLTIVMLLVPVVAVVRLVLIIEIGIRSLLRIVSRVVVLLIATHWSSDSDARCKPKKRVVEKAETDWVER